MPPSVELRKRRGAWYTPPELVDIVVDGVEAAIGVTPGARVLRVLDPACGDGRFLSAVADRLVGDGHAVELVGCDVDADALASVTDPRIRTIHDDALRRSWGPDAFDIVVGNPPFLSQMAASTSRGGSSRHGGGPYADAAVEFLALSVELARPDGGVVGLVLPQSVLGARDAEPVRRRVGEISSLEFSWWSPRQQHFDADVNVCAIGLRRSDPGTIAPTDWTAVVTDALGIPPLEPDRLDTDGSLGDRADLNANFRDEYYALVPAVADGASGPPLVTSGLIDPGVCHWGTRPVRFAKQTFDAPRVDLSKLSGRFPAWAERKLVPKVLVANQTRVIEAVADPTGEWLPGVPVATATPTSRPGAQDPLAVWRIAAVLTSPIASVAAWHRSAGTGLSPTSVRVGPATLAATPWPAGSLDGAVDALRAGAVVDCGRSVCEAFACPPDHVDDLVSWWSAQLPGGPATA